MHKAKNDRLMIARMVKREELDEMVRALEEVDILDVDKDFEDAMTVKAVHVNKTTVIFAGLETAPDWWLVRYPKNLWA